MRSEGRSHDGAAAADIATGRVPRPDADPAAHCGAERLLPERTPAVARPDDETGLVSRQQRAGRERRAYCLARLDIRESASAICRSRSWDACW